MRIGEHLLRFTLLLSDVRCNWLPASAMNFPPIPESLKFIANAVHAIDSPPTLRIAAPLSVP